MMWHTYALQKRRLQKFGITIRFHAERRAYTPEKKAVRETPYFDGKYNVNEVYADGCAHVLCHGLYIYSLLVGGKDVELPVFDALYMYLVVRGRDAYFDLYATGMRGLFYSPSGNRKRLPEGFLPEQSFPDGKARKVSAIHFAETNTQVNAFFDCDLSAFLQRYAQVIGADIKSMSLDAYEVQDGVQHGKVKAGLRLREFINGRLKTRTETVQMELEKNADCKTQAVCAASVLTCKGCGSSLSLMEGKTCHYCGRELDLKRYDWVITSYRIIANI